MIKISVFVITYNEENNISRCLQSVSKVADEVIVIDSFSTDKTVEISKEMGAKVILRKFEGYYDQKKFGTEQTANDWVLNLDADEALSEELINSILNFKANPTADACNINRYNYYCGKWIKHSSWYPDRKIRLWNKNKAQWHGINIHEKVHSAENAKVINLKGDILHLTFKNLSQHIAQTNKFTDIAAKEDFENGRKISYFTIIFGACAKFLKTYFINLGFLDGWQGFQISYMAAFSGFSKYTKIKELQKVEREKHKDKR